jgi:hypothetical protein
MAMQQIIGASPITMIKILTALAFAIVFVSAAHAADSCDKIRNILTRDNRVEILNFSNDSIMAAHMTILCGSGRILLLISPSA